eukprot:1015048-Rhodomonas_salina.1
MVMTCRGHGTSRPGHGVRVTLSESLQNFPIMRLELRAASGGDRLELKVTRSTLRPPAVPHSERLVAAHAMSVPGSASQMRTPRNQKQETAFLKGTSILRHVDFFVRELFK